MWVIHMFVESPMGYPEALIDAVQPTPSFDLAFCLNKKVYFNILYFHHKIYLNYLYICE